MRIVKPRKVVLLSDAVQDLRGIRDDVRRASSSRQVADSYLKKIRRRLRTLEYAAAACPRFFNQEGKDSGYRFCIAENHVAFFTFDDETVQVKRILHKRMNVDGSLIG